MIQKGSIHELVNEALSYYSFVHPIIELIRHNENITYKVMDFGKQYVMRIHRPIEGFSLGVFGVTSHSNSYIQSELDIILALKSNTDIPLQEPVKNKYGDVVTVMSNNIPVTILNWMEGDTIDASEMSNEMLFKIGEMTAKIHQYFMNSKTELKFKRYTYDPSTLPLIADRIMLARDFEYINQEQSRLLISSIEEIGRRMEELDLLTYSKGIVHADLSKCNMIWDSSRIAPIDFGLCGYGYYYMDLGSLFIHFPEDNERYKIVQGYQSIIKREINPWYIEPFFALQVILFIACQYEKASQEDWFQGAMKRWSRDIFEPLNNKKVFI